MKRPNIPHARTLRHDQTDAERAIWRQLRNRHLLGLKFRRQHPIGRFIVDFVCVEQMLVVELDGGQHVDLAARDGSRTQWLRSEGYTVLRFWNDDVLTAMDRVLEQIVAVLDESGGRGLDTSPHPAPLPGGEREKADGLPKGESEKAGALPGGEREKSGGGVA